METQWKGCAVLLVCATVLAGLPVSAGPVEQARQARTSGDQDLALKLYQPLAEEGVAEAQFFVGTFKLNRGTSNSNDKMLDEARSLLQKAAEQGHGEAAWRICQWFVGEYDPEEALAKYGAPIIASFCSLAAAQRGKPLQPLTFDPNYVVKAQVNAGYMLSQVGEDLRAGSCYVAYLRDIETVDSKTRNQDYMRNNVEFAQKGLRRILAHKAFTGRYNGPQANEFGPMGTEPVPPCGPSAVDVGATAGRDMLKALLGAQ